MNSSDNTNAMAKDISLVKLNLKNKLFKDFQHNWLLYSFIY